MEVRVVKDYEKLSAKAGEIVVDAVRKKPDIVLGLAPGSTPLGLYGAMAKAHEAQGGSFARVVAFNLDEYVGLPPDHPQSYRCFMDSNLFNHINIEKKNTHVPDGLAKNLMQFCKKYERMIKEAGSVDIQVLGIGRPHRARRAPGALMSLALRSHPSLRW